MVVERVFVTLNSLSSGFTAFNRSLLEKTIVMKVILQKYFNISFIFLELKGILEIVLDGFFICFRASTKL